MGSTVKVCLFSFLIGFASAAIDPDCQFVGEFCDPEDSQADQFTLSDAAVDMPTAIDECYDECNLQKDDPTSPCLSFTVRQTGPRPPTCFLLRSPCVLNSADACLGSMPDPSCVSGPSDCLATAQTWPCEYVEGFCDLDGAKSDVFPLTDTVTDIDTAAEECYTACNAQKAADANADATNPCKAFTVMSVREQFFCNLIRENCVLNIVDACIFRSPPTCKSGPSDCAVPPPTCNPAVGFEDRVRWQCVDIAEEAINPYNDPLPLGTRCQQMCSSWESATVDGDARLVSECIESLTVPGEGEWSETQNIDGLEMIWPTYPTGQTYYPKPDEMDPSVALACECKPLEVQWPFGSGNWYNPNKEEVAVFICDQEVNTMGDTEFIIDSTNTCVLYCDDNYVATVTCLDGEWTGNPEWGFWCNDEPTGM